MVDHSTGVTRNYLALENSLEKGYWDEIGREVSYFENQDSPLQDLPRGSKGREVGEFDYVAVNYEDRVFLYGEVKTNWGDLEAAESQLGRAEEFFGESGWEMIGQTWLEDG